jgi:chemotaxis protein histidine kinase CheA
MGRHSAPDDAVDDAADATATVDLDKPHGRHARTDAGAATALDDRDTQMIAVIDPEVLPDDVHDTDEIAPPEQAIVPLEEAPAKPSRADRRQQKKAAKAAAAEVAAAEKTAAKAAKAARKAESKTAEPAVLPDEKAKKRRTKKDGSQTNTQADLRLLRENGAVRARCIAAVLVSFLLYTVVMVVISRADAYVLWLWIPIVVSGFLVGVVLDLAHKAAKKAIN